MFVECWCNSPLLIGVGPSSIDQYIAVRREHSRNSPLLIGVGPSRTPSIHNLVVPPNVTVPF